MVDAQVAAAYTYQSWGHEKPGRYLLAITGSQKYREIWGWGELARRLAPVAQQRETYCEARYNLAWCRFRLAQSASAAERGELLDRAEDDILATRRFYPDLGGKAWYDRYKELLKTIQQARAQQNNQEKPMKRCLISAVAVACLASGTMCWALDKITQTKGPMLVGTVTSVTALEVQLEVKGLHNAPATTKTVPVNEIKMISYDDDPRALTRAREHISKEEYEEAETSLKDLKPADKRAEVATDIEFYKALCAAKEALGGSGAVADATASMEAFAKNHSSSYHYLEACELAGKLLVADRKYAQAEPYYAELAKAPWEDYKMRAGIGAGRAKLAQGKTAEALKAFDEVLGNASTDDQAESQRVVAKLGKARCLAATNKTDEAIKIAQDIIDKSDADKNNDLLAEAYNTMGTSLHKAGRTKEAMLAFLHVNVLYNSSPDLHAEALANLVNLFNELHKPDHAGTCLNKLRQNYPNSPWTLGR